MLSNAAMALLPAASLVGAAPLASTGENHGFIAVNYPYWQENACKCLEDPRAKERS
jgi:hypothetical protein